jgi:hypothetical protein
MKLILEGTDKQIRLYKYLMDKATKHIVKDLLPKVTEVDED